MSSCDVPSVLVAGEDGDRGDRGRTTDVVGQGDSRPVNLILGLTAKLVEQFVALRNTRSTGWVTLRLEATARVDGHRPADVVLTALDELVRLEALGETEVLVTDQLDPREAVVHLGNVDVTRGHTRHA